MAEKCDYEFNGEKICNEKVFIDSKGNPDPDGYCIFHSRKLKEKRKRFDEEFERKFKEYDQDPNKIYDFRGYIFPNDFKISDYKTNEFKKNVNFSHANFHGQKTDFSRAEFYGPSTVFNGAEFHGQKTDFFVAEFHGQYTSFCGAEFHGQYTYFTASEFHGQVTDFPRTEFHGQVTDFTEAEFHGQETLFPGAKFHGQKTSFFKAKFHGQVTDFPMAKFHGQETDFSRAEFHGEETNFFEAEFHCEKISFEWAEFKNNLLGLFDKGVLKKKHTFLRKNKYKIKNDNLLMFLDDKISAKYPILARTVKDSIYLNRFKEDHKISYFFWWLFADCGRSIKRWAVASVIFMLLFGIIYSPEVFSLLPVKLQSIIGSIRPVFDISPVGRISTLFTPFYYSIVTFTTLGFGDIKPMNLSGEIFVTLEVLLGYIMLGGLISILAVKLARRS